MSAERDKSLLNLLDLIYLKDRDRLSIEQMYDKYSYIFHLPGDKLTTTNLME